MKAKRKVLALVWLGCLTLGTVGLLLGVATPRAGDSGVRADTAAEAAQAAVRPLVYTLVIDGPIGVVTDERIEKAIGLCQENGAELLVILLDTPGGFSTATRSINKRLLNSPVPVCVFVYPPGARAGSAGVFITYAAHIAAMAPSTNIGAAHPVFGQKEDVDSVMTEKVTNDAVAQIRATAHKRGRNAEWAEKAVRESVSITGEEALELNVIDLIAEDLDDLLAQIDGREVELPEGNRRLNLKDARVENIEITFMQRLRRLITDPSVVFILFSLGGLGIVIELYNPGAIFPGVVGAICLILAFYGFQTLPINYAGVALILLAILLFIAEIKVISHGLLTVGGIISLMLGGMLLIDDIDPAVQVSRTVLFTVGGFLLVVLLLVMWLVAKVHLRRPFVGSEGLVGKKAEVRTPDMVYVEGALWQAESDEPLQPGDRVEIVAVDGLTLRVRKLNT